MNQFDLTGKTALVTGCKRGIGKAMAIGLAEAGANIVGVSASLELIGSEVAIPSPKILGGDGCVSLIAKIIQLKTKCV